MSRFFLPALAAVLVSKVGAMEQGEPMEICKNLKASHKDMGCCGGKANMQSVCMSKQVEPAEKPKVPELLGIMPGHKAKISLAYDIWSPYVYIDTDTQEPTGFGPEFVKLMQNHESEACSALDITMVEDTWARMYNDLRSSNLENHGVHPGNPWSKDVLGDGTNHGLYHGGITYTHLKGHRNRVGDFSYSLTMPSAQPYGLIVKLKDGKPMVSPTSDLEGQIIVDVATYAPTVDTFEMVQNWCNGGAAFGAVEWIQTAAGNKAAMAEFKSREDVFLMYTYADQALDCIGQRFEGDCEGWEGFGETYAYLHMGLDANINGTSIAYGKKNSGLMERLNPCIQDVMETMEYHDLCLAPERAPDQMSNLMAKCYPNAHWTQKETDDAAAAQGVWGHNQEKRTDSLMCKDGWCTCSE